LTTTAYNVEKVAILCFEMNLLAETATKGQLTEQAYNGTKDWIEQSFSRTTIHNQHNEGRSLVSWVNSVLVELIEYGVRSQETMFSIARGTLDLARQVSIARSALSHLFSMTIEHRDRDVVLVITC
jgi:hypothetical protein